MEWTRGPTIGRGSSAIVSLATTSSGDHFAVKSTDFSRSTFLQREQYFLSQLSSVYLTKYMGFDVSYEDNKSMYNLFMEYVPGGSISDVIKKQGGSLDEPMIRSYTSQILQGLDYLHGNNLVHCDIKGQNVLVGKDNVIKIGDLGCVKKIENGCAAVSAFSGTPVFMAPEVARGEEQGFPADVWAVGCTIIEMATGSNPWPELDDPVSAIYRIGYSSDLPQFPRLFSDEGKDFLDKCLKRNSNERWTVKELLQHPFVHNLKTNYEETEEFVRKSPTSILDQTLWDSFEVSESSRDATKFVDSPVNRIMQLVGDASQSVPNWTLDDEHWVTIRGNEIDEISKNFEWDAYLESDDIESTRVDSLVLSVASVDGVEDESPISINNVLFDRELHVGESSSVSSNIMTDDLVLSCESVDDIYVFLDLDENNNEKDILFSSGVARAEYASFSIWVDDSFQVKRNQNRIADRFSTLSSLVTLGFLHSWILSRKEKPKCKPTPIENHSLRKNKCISNIDK